MGTGKEIGSQIWGPEKKMYPKSRTGKENVSQKWGPENKLVLKSGDRKDFFRSQLLRLKLFSGPYFWDTFSFPVPIFENQFLFPGDIYYLGSELYLCYTGDVLILSDLYLCYPGDVLIRV